MTNNIALKHINWKLMKLQGIFDMSTIMVGDFGNTFILKTARSSKKNVSKNIEVKVVSDSLWPHGL